MRNLEVCFDHMPLPEKQNIYIEGSRTVPALVFPVSSMLRLQVQTLSKKLMFRPTIQAGNYRVNELGLIDHAHGSGSIQCGCTHPLEYCVEISDCGTDRLSGISNVRAEPEIHMFSAQIAPRSEKLVRIRSAVTLVARLVGGKVGFLVAGLL